MTTKLSVFKPLKEVSAQENLAAFISHCRNEVTAFGADLDWESHRWDLTAYIHLKAKRSAIRIVFNCWVSSKPGTKDLQPLSEPYLSFAKSYIRYQHALRPTKSFERRLLAIRALAYASMERSSSQIHALDRAVFNRAAQLIAERYSASAAYRYGIELEFLASFLDAQHLCIVHIGFKNPLKRPTNQLERVGDNFDELRFNKLPSPTSLDALARAFCLAETPVDQFITSVAALMCASPDRINEVLNLRADCIYEGTVDGRSAIGLRYWPSKGASPQIKWVIPAMRDIVKEAIGKLLTITDDGRTIAKWYEVKPTSLFLHPEHEHLRGRTDLALTEVESIVFEKCSKGAGLVWCRRHGIPIEESAGKLTASFFDVEQALLKLLPQKFPFRDPETGLKFSEALCVVKRQQFQSRKATYRSVIEFVGESLISEGLGGNLVNHSVFDRLGFTEADGSRIVIRTHQFRHYLNTLAQQGGLSELDLAKWSGRSNIRQNSAYNHISDRDLQAKLLALKGDEEKSFGTLVEQARISPVARARFKELEISTAHTTDYGYCVHDFAMSPCQLHADCMNCNEQVCVKGDDHTEFKTRAMLNETEKLLDQARQADSEFFYGASRWVEHQTMTVARLRELIEILDNPLVMPGAVIRLTHVKAASRLEQAVAVRQTILHGQAEKDQLQWTVDSPDDENVEDSGE